MADLLYVRRYRHQRKFGANQWVLVRGYACTDSTVDTYTAAYWNKQHAAIEAGLDTKLRCREVNVEYSGWAPGSAKMIVRWESVRDPSVVRVELDSRTFTRRGLRDSNFNMIEGYDGIIGETSGVPSTTLTAKAATFGSGMAGCLVFFPSTGSTYEIESVTSTTICVLDATAAAEGADAAFVVQGRSWVIARGRNLVYEPFGVARLETAFRANSGAEYLTMYNTLLSWINDYNSAALSSFPAKRLLCIDFKTAKSWHETAQWDLDIWFAVNAARDWDTEIQVRAFSRMPANRGVELEGEDERGMGIISRDGRVAAQTRNPFGSNAFTWLADKTWSWT